MLEDRLAPANVVLGELEFVGDFTQSGNSYSVLGQGIQLGYAPLAGEVFQPVYTINGQVDFNTDNPQTFQVTNATFFTAPFSGSGGNVIGPFDVWTGSATFNVEQLVNDGFALSNPKSITFEGYTLTIEGLALGPPPENGIPYVPTVELRGSLKLGDSGISVAIDGSNYVGISAAGFTITGFSASLTKKFDLFGVEFQPKNATISYDETIDQFSIYGDVEFSLEDGGDSQITAVMGNSENPGILWQNGAFQQVSMGISGDIELGDPDGPDGELIKLESPVNAPLTFAWQGSASGNSYLVSGTGTIVLGSAIKASVSLGDTSNPGLSVIDGAFSLNAISLSLGDINFGAFTLKSLSIDFTQSPGTFDIGGSVFVVIPGNWGLQGSLEFNNTGIENIAINVTLGEEGIPIGPTGLFVTSAGLGVQNLGEPADFTITGSMTVDYGGQIAIDGKSATIVSAGGSVTVNKDMFELTGNLGFGTYTVTDGQGNKSQKNLFGSGTGTVDLDWGSHEYSATVNASFFDDAASFGASFSLDAQNNVNITADADLNVPKGVPLVGGDHVLGGDAVFQWFGEQKTGYLAAWTTIVGIDAGFEYDLANFNGDSSDFSIIGNGTVAAIQSGQNNPRPSVFTYFQTFQVPTGATVGTFQVSWPSVSGTQSVTLTPPVAPGQSNSPITPTSTTANGITLVSQELSSFTVQAVSPTGGADTPLPAGEYTLTLTSSVALSTSFTGTFSYPQPTVVIGNLPTTPDSSSITIPLSATVDDAFQSDTTISVYYDTDNSGYNGRHIATIPYASSASVTWDFGQLLPKTYYVYAQIKSGSNSSFTTASTQSPVSSAYSNAVTPSPPVTGTVTDTQNNPVSGVVVFLDLNGNSTFEPPEFNAQGQQIGGDDAALTTRDGVYAFYAPSTTPSGFESATTYYVGIVIPDGFLLNSPLLNPAPVAFRSHAKVDFVLDELNSITGTIYADTNQNGQQDAGERPYAGQEIYIDLNDNQMLDFGEPTATSSITGAYTFYNVAPGTTNILRWNATSPFVQTQPAASGGTNGFYTVTYANTDQFEKRSGNDFGLLRFATVSGSVIGYPVANGQASSTPVALSGITVLLQQNGDTVMSTTSGPDGSYTFSNVAPGEYSIAQELPANYLQLTPVSYDLSYTRQNFQTQFGTNQILGAYSNATGQVPSSFAAGDLDGDGTTDYVVVGGTISSISNPPQYTDNPNPLDLIPQAPEVLTDVKASANRSVYVYYGAIDNLPTEPTQTATVYPVQAGGLWQGGGTQIVLPLDYFGTGRLDLAIATPTSVVLLQNQGSQKFQEIDPFPLGFVQQGARVVSMERGDFTGDGKDDLLVMASINVSQVQLVLIAYNFQYPTDLPLSEVFSTTISLGTNNVPRLDVADIDGDGKLDFAVGNGAQGFPVYGLGDGTGKFTVFSTNFPALPHTDSSSVGGYNAIALADIDGDGLMNAVYSYSTLFGGNSPSQGTTFLMFAEWSPQDSNWIFEAASIQLPAEAAGYYSTDDIALTDINGDSLPDLVVLRANYGGDFPVNYFEQMVASAPSYPAPITIQYEIAVFLNNGTAKAYSTTPDKMLTNAGPDSSPYPYLAMGNPRMTLGGLSIRDTGALSVWQNLSPLEPGVDVYLSRRTPIRNVAVTVNDRADLSGIDFVNAEFDQAGGVVFNDVNRNGVQDKNETGFAGATLYSDTNENGQYDLGEPTATTNAAGVYSFSNLPSDAGTIRLDPGNDLVTTGTPGASAAARSMAAFASASQTTDFGVAPRLLNDIPLLTGVAGQSLTAQASKTPAAASYNLKFRLIGEVPEGAAINALTGVVTWTPSYAKAPGHHQLTVEAYDLDNPFATETVTLDVDLTGAEGSQRIVANLYHAILGREPESAGLAYWSAQIAAGLAPAEIARQIRESEESLGRIVDNCYARYLSRAADATGRAEWISLLHRGLDESELAIGFLASEEFAASNLPLADVVTRLYDTVLGRLPSADEIAGWQISPAAGPPVHRNALAAGFVQSPEAFLNRVDETYAAYLGRDPSDAELASWSSLDNLSADALAAAFAGSDEFYHRFT